MARAHGRILSSIWEDPDFTPLHPEEQRLYLFLLSQANLNHAGLLPITLKRWAGKTADTTPAHIAVLLQGLEQARFIVMDEDTEELLVRTLIRNDGVWRQPNVMSAAVNAAGEISSLKLRRALLAEMSRLPLDQLSDDPSAKGGASVRAQIGVHVEQMRRVLNVPPDPDPVSEVPSSTRQEPIARGSEPIESPSVPVADRSGAAPEPIANPSGRVPTRARVRAYSPTPSPTPAPEQREGARASEVEAARWPDGRTPIPDDFQLSDAMRRWAAATFPALDPDYETQQFISHHRAEGSRRKSWPDEWQKWMRRGAKYASERANRQPPLLQALPGGAPVSRLDQKIAAGLALAARFEAEERQAT